MLKRKRKYKCKACGLIVLVVSDKKTISTNCWKGKGAKGKTQLILITKPKGKTK